MSPTYTAPGPLGFIVPSQRTQGQQDAADTATAAMPRFSMPAYADPPVGTKVMLTDFWKTPEVVADIGQPFTGFGQYTGSCVGVSEGTCGTTLLCVQRMIGEAPTKAEVWFWPFPYGRTRYNEGDRGQGEGAVDSIMGDTLVKEGYFAATESGLPQFTKTGPDGFWYSQAIEMKWSDGGSIAQNWKTLAAQRAGLTKAIVNDTAGIRAAVTNGYPILNGCSNYVGHGQVVAGGGTPYARGKYDGRGGHSTSVLGVWNHPNDGWLYLYSNQWPTSTYPTDPAGGGRCCVWIPESEMVKLFQTGGDNGECMALSHAPGFPMQPRVLDWSTI